MSYRTDRNNNPTAFTTDLAKRALQEGVEYTQGDPFASNGVQYFTAKLLKDPVELTIKLIDKLTFYTSSGGQRWIYIAIPSFVWSILSPELKKQVIGFMYQHEGGIAMKDLFK